MRWRHVVPRYGQRWVIHSSKGCQVVTVPTDMTDRTALEALVAEAQRELGTIDVLVNNAGIVTLAAYH